MSASAKWPRTYGVTLRTLRFYEDKGLLSPKRDGSTRLYTRRDSARLKLILLGRKVGFSLRDVKQMMDLYDPTGSNTKQLRLTLEKSEKQLARLQKQRAVIDEAIGELSEHDGDRAPHAGRAHRRHGRRKLISFHWPSGCRSATRSLA